MELGGEDNNGLSQQACTAGRHASAETDHAHISDMIYKCLVGR